MDKNRAKSPCGTYFRAVDCNAWIDVVIVCQIAMPIEVKGEPFKKDDYIIMHGATPAHGYSRNAFRKRYRPIGSWAGFDAGAYNREGPCDD